MKITCEVRNWDSFKQQLQKLPDKLQKKAIKPALRQISRMARDEMKRIIKSEGHYKTGALYDSIRAATAPDKKGYPAMTLAGVTRKAAQALATAKIQKSPAMKMPYYWRFLEFGFKHKKGHYKVEGVFFRKRAYELVKPRARQLMEAYINTFNRGFNRGAA